MDTRRWVHQHLNIDGAEAPICLEKFSRKSLAKLFRTLGYELGAEIGVENGRYSKQLCAQNPDMHLLCVDAWLGYPEYTRRVSPEKFASQIETTRQRLAHYDAEIIHALSMDAVREVEPGKGLVVVYRELQEDGFVITAFLTRRMKSLQRRSQLWP